MNISSQGTVLFSSNPNEDSKFYIDSFGFEKVAELDFYVSLQHPDLKVLSLDFLNEKENISENRKPSVLLAFVTDDAQAEKERLESLGVTICMPVRDEPWGQRRFRMEAPCAIVEIVQSIEPDKEWMKSKGLA